MATDPDELPPLDDLALRQLIEEAAARRARGAFADFPPVERDELPDLARVLGKCSVEETEAFILAEGGRVVPASPGGLACVDVGLFVADLPAVLGRMLGRYFDLPPLVAADVPEFARRAGFEDVEAA